MSDEWIVTMPKLGETVTEGTVGGWRKQVGDSVEFDDPLFEVSTDKVDSEIPSPYDGVILEILVPEGETVPVGTPLVRIGAPGSTPPGGNGGPPAVVAGGAGGPPPPGGDGRPAGGGGGGGGAPRGGCSRDGRQRWSVAQRSGGAPDGRLGSHAGPRGPRRRCPRRRGARDHDAEARRDGDGRDRRRMAQAGR